MNTDRSAVTTDDETSSINEESSSNAASSPSNMPPTAATGNHNPPMKRSAVKKLIERYFFQLQRGCGNPKCSNANCASSGKVVQMTANQIAAKALQLFAQDAKLCEFFGQPPKVARTHTESPTSSRSVSSASQLDTEMHSPNDSSGSSSSSSGTITSGSTKSTSSTSSTTTNSSNTNISSCPIEELIRLEPNSTASTSSSVVENHMHNTTDLMRPRPISPNCRLDSSAVYTSGPPTPTLAPVSHLNEQVVDELLEECIKYKTCDRLLHAINEVYSSVDKLSLSFVRPANAISDPTPIKVTRLQEMISKTTRVLKKEDIRILEGENDKDEDSTQKSLNTPDASEPMELEISDLLGAASSTKQALIRKLSEDSETKVDLESLRRVRNKLFALKNPLICEALNDNFILLAEYITFGFDFTRFTSNDEEKMVHCFIICFDMATNTSNSYADLEYLERSLPKLCHAINMLSISAQARIARIWATHCADTLQSLVQSCQQLITLQVILDEDSVQEDSDVVAVTKVLKIAFYANILAGQLETKKQLDITKENGEASTTAADAVATNDDDDIFFYTRTNKPHYLKFGEDKLEKELGVCSMDCRVPLLPFEDFYNEPLSDAIQMDRDYLAYKNLTLDLNNGEPNFSFMLYSFILTPATKVIALYYDSRIRMYSERTSSLYSLLNYYGDDAETRLRPDLKLKVRRDNLIEDALISLEMVAMSNPKDLKKQLVVEFQDEQGIDEGGVSKEFFQLIVEEIFNPDFGMFTHQEETNTVWFNSTPFENEAQFTLVGIILGLAIYNNIILAVNFPMVVYRKLMGGQGTFHDLKDWNPTLYRSLKSLLDYQEDNIEEVFMQTFQISYSDVFGAVVDHELLPNGDKLIVGHNNKREFVDLYSDFLLNKSIERQFRAFRKGFDMVTDESPLKLLFRAEEVELLVCGSRKFDFIELEKSTEYEGGYTKETQIIKDFWQVVHSMPEESKRKLLEFTTGSDRVPVGGLSRLKLLITRHGPDSDRLPTSHTCFNVLLLPEYTSKDKLEERLLKAINYSKGFGML